MKKTSIFFSDLDGTLLNDQKIITFKTKQAIKTYSNSGNHFVICTGRPLYSAIHLFTQHNLPDKGSFIISYNGSQIYDCETKALIYDIGIDPNDVLSLFELAKEYDIYLQTFTNTHMVTNVHNEYTDYYKKNVHIPTIVNKNLIEALTDPLTGKVIHPGKVFGIEFYEKSRMDRFRDRALHLFGDRLTMLYSSDCFLEIFPASAGKGNAVKFLCDYLSIPLEKATSAGDMDNDYSMLTVTGRSIAMKNASDSIKAICTDITTYDNNHDGLVEYLEESI